MAAVALNPPHAAAHAVIRSSVPAAGATLQQSPKEVSITFTEGPEPAFSSIQVLDSSGRSFIRGKAEVVPGMPLTIRVAVPQISQGVFTVSWRAFSRVDGHTTAGSFAFGVGVSPEEAPVEAEGPAGPEISSQELVGRWVFYLGMVILLGTALVGSLAFEQPPPSTRRLLAGALVVSLVGLRYSGMLSDKPLGLAGVRS